MPICTSELPHYTTVWACQSGAASAAPSAPPSLSGGVNSQVDGEVSVHWVQGTVPVERVFALAEFLAGHFGNPEIVQWGRFRYDCACVFGSGVMIYFDSSEERATKVHRGRACLCVPGSALDILSGAELHQFLKRLVGDFWLKGTRVDVSWDDYKRRVQVADVAIAAWAGNFSGFKNWREDKRCTRSSVKGHCLTFGERGERGGGKALRVYDKRLESNGEKDCIRWEVEFSGEKARAVLLQFGFAPSVEVLGGMIGALVGGCIRFVERSEGGKNIERLSVLPWWEGIVSMLGSIRLRGMARGEDFERSQEWVAASVSKTLGMCKEGMGDAAFWAWVRSLVDGPGARLTARHRRILYRHREDNIRECFRFFEDVAQCLSV